jgi:DNA-binding response OmpR family regulator
VIRNGEFDMLVLEAKEHLEAVREHIQDIRHGRLGSNPFLVINVITWKPSDDVIRTFIDAGADDIIVMPISIGAVMSRVDNIIENRKKFIATSGYLGPDRRHLNREDDSDLASFEVPNGVRFKATGDESAKVDLEKIERANAIVGEHRLRRTTLQFSSFATDMERLINENPDRDIPMSDLSEMSDLGRYIARHTETDSRPEIRELVESLQNVMDETIVDGRSEANLFALLRVHGEALLALLRGEDEAADLVVRAVLTASEIVDARVHKRKQAAEAE